MKKPGLPLLMALATATCGHTAREAPRSPDPGLTGDPVASTATAMEGQAVFEFACSQCHTIDPPAQNAPPLSHIARHYRAEFGTRETTTTRIVEWLRAPSPDRSILPAHAIGRWGVMPPAALGDAEATAVASYVWSLAEDRPGPMAQRGQGIGSSRMQSMQAGRMGMMRGRMGQSMMGAAAACPMHRGAQPDTGSAGIR
jgi:cytochrome c